MISLLISGGLILSVTVLIALLRRSREKCRQLIRSHRQLQERVDSLHQVIRITDEYHQKRGKVTAEKRAAVEKLKEAKSEEEVYSVANTLVNHWNGVSEPQDE